MSVEHRLIFVISAPRSGSTVLMRILNAAPGIVGRPEFHLLPPLAHLGLWRTVERAPFDSLQAQQAMAALVRDLPGGEADYVAACRAYADALYGGVLATAPAGTQFVVDKTPANALVLPELRRLYPAAKVIVLTRHPAAVFVSYAEAFFDGDFEAAARFNPILSRYLPAIARFLAEDQGPNLHVRYEDLLSEPTVVLEKISAFVGITVPDEALQYGQVPGPEGLGDPQAGRLGRLEARPQRWKTAMADPVKRAVMQRQLVGVSAAELAVWGASEDDFTDGQDGGETRRHPRWRGGRLAVERAVLLRLREAVQKPRLKRLVQQVRKVCDVLLR